MEGSITISRPHGIKCDYISIKFRDESSRTGFMEARIRYADFAEALTGLSEVPCEITVRGLNRVGKQQEIDKIEFKVAGAKHKYGEELRRLAENSAKEHTPEGWEADKYYGSQNSFFTRYGETWARTTIRRWI